MLSLILATLVFFVANHMLKRRFEALELPEGMTRRALQFSLALGLAYGVAALVDKLTG